MVISSRRALLVLSVIMTAVGFAMGFNREADWLAWIVVFCALASVIILNLFPGERTRSSRRDSGPREDDDIRTLTTQRRKELVRGTSMHLRELRYRYSIRFDPMESLEHQPFTAEVNTVKLGFVPVVIIDNTNDRQGYGYVAFVHDGNRWRGPGLPCPAGQVEAVRHAAKCVSPLAKEEETKF